MSVAEFAREWVDAWNSQDLDRILAHYADDVVFTSPKAAARLPDTRGTVRGIDGLRVYWTPLRELRPDLRFTLRNVFETVDGCTLVYTDEAGGTTAETMLFGPDGKVVRGIASYLRNEERDRVD